MFGVVILVLFDYCDVGFQVFQFGVNVVVGVGEYGQFVQLFLMDGDEFGDLFCLVWFCVGVFGLCDVLIEVGDVEQGVLVFGVGVYVFKFSCCDDICLLVDFVVDVELGLVFVDEVVVFLQ